MDKKSKILIWIFAVLIIISIGATYWRIMIKKDYIISAQADCNPYTEKCFIWECDPESDIEGEKCTGDSENDIWYFQVVNRKAFNIPLCDPNDETCEALVCPEGEADCAVEFCTEDNMESQYVSACNDPIKFTEENPIEEETECDPEGEEECPVTEEGAEISTETDDSSEGSTE